MASGWRADEDRNTGACEAATFLFARPASAALQATCTLVTVATTPAHAETTEQYLRLN
ncbi:hypothetical protein [Streptomyces sp. NPDC059788]|uniref:hypothetical protein n=1 Tax=Streptomyces sp. NPDC059788 TaxID=3346948 RepID=UPI00365856C9